MEKQPYSKGHSELAGAGAALFSRPVKSWLQSERLRIAYRLLIGQSGECWAAEQEEDLDWAEEIAEGEGCPLSLFQLGEGLFCVETGE